MTSKAANSIAALDPARRAGSDKKIEKQNEKQNDKKRELALHTLSALAEVGFARINLRDIAARSGVSLGTIHYYFEDKTELLSYCVRLYKDDFIGRLAERIESANTLEDLLVQFSDALVRAVDEDAHTHRLWYDIRAQALFDEAFRPVVNDLEEQLTAIVGRFVEKVEALGGSGIFSPPDPLSVYLMLDGWFRYCLQQRVAGDKRALAEWERKLAGLLHTR